MSPRIWLPVAVLGLAGGAVVAMLTNRMALDNVESANLPQPGADEASTVDSESASVDKSEMPVSTAGEGTKDGAAGEGAQNSTVDEGAQLSAQDAGEGGAENDASAHALALQSLSEVDRTLPEFSLPSLDETLWTPDTLKGKPWVINFWATWCPPCIEEIPSMNSAYEVLEPQGIGMLAINAGEGALAVEAFLQKIAIEFPNVLGDANTLPNWTVKALPTTIVVDAEGRVVYEALGPREWDDEALLQHVIDLL